MKKLAWLVLLPMAAMATVRDDYARQWPLNLETPDAGAYRVTLDREVYLQAQSPQLRDAVVVDAGGGTVSSSLFGPEQPLARPPRDVQVPWFPLSLQNSSLDRDIAAISEIGSDGSLRRVQMRERSDAATEYVVDLSRIGEPVSVLVVDWAPGQGPFERRFAVAASDDLKDWSMVAPGARLLELENAGQRLAEHRIALPQPARARYLRLMPPAGQAPLQITGMRVELPPRAADLAWQWEDLAGKAVTEQGVRGFEYTLPGRFPMRRADVVLPGNSSNQWRLYSREDERTPWRPATNPWLAYGVAGSNGGRSDPQALHDTRRDRYWRLVAEKPGQAQVPTLRLGYRDEVMVFLAEGSAPYALLAGSGRAVREDAALPQLVDALRQQRGPDWQPAVAALGAGQVLAGDAALAPAPAERDWKSWLLWVLLVGGAALVAWFAISLLKGPRGES
jgi:hypothetical protein